jgi:hypothetical protein
VSGGDRRSQYARAFYEQASSDWQAYELLARSADLPRCHSLHYLQMACEKLEKAYRLRSPSADVDTIVTRHVGFTKFVNEFLRSYDHGRLLGTGCATQGDLPGGGCHRARDREARACD